jgi:hypothetical protein
MPPPPYQVTDQSVIKVVSIHTNKLSTGTTQVLHRLYMRDYVAPIKYYFSDTIVLRVNTYLQSYPHMAVDNLLVTT